MGKNYFKISIFILFWFVSLKGFGQCADNSNIYSFVYGGKTYEVIRENKTWSDAAACALLLHIDLFIFGLLFNIEMHLFT